LLGNQENFDINGKNAISKLYICTTLVFYVMLSTLPIHLNPARPVIDLIRLARLGVARRRVDEIAAKVGLTDIEMARILNMSVRSLHGKANNERLNLAGSERLLLLERLIQHGLSVFDGKADLLNRWLHTPLAELAYRAGGDETPQPFSIRKAGSFSPPAQNTPSVERPASKVPDPQTPLAVLDTVVGFSLAEDVLGRIEWGIVG